MSEAGFPAQEPYAACVGANVGASMETASPPPDRVLLLGPVQIIRNGAQLSLPRSRKARALLAYLAMAPRPVSREKLCELFWDVADDPKSELRWCLSKLRPLVDGPTATRLIADRERVRIDTSSLDIDAVSLARDAQTTLTGGSPGIFSRSEHCSVATFSKASASTGLHCSTTGWQASGTVTVNGGNSCSSGLPSPCRRRAMVASRCCVSASKLPPSMKRLTSSSFARCFAARFMPRPSTRSMHR